MYEVIKFKEVYTRDTQGKVICGKTNVMGFDRDLILAVLVVVTSDFNIDETVTDVEIVGEMHSFQVRPKALFKSSRGYYFKGKSGRRYLTSEEIERLTKQNPRLGAHISDSKNLQINMTQHIKITNNTGNSGLANKDLGRQFYNEQVKGRVDFSKHVTIDFSDGVDCVSILFADGFLEDIIQQIGRSTCNTDITFVGTDRVKRAFYMAINYF